MEDAPAWAEGLPADHPAFLLLSRVEADWQLQRVPGWALAIGLATHPDDPASGYAAAFDRWPQFRAEEAPVEGVWSSVEKRLPGLIGADRRLLPEIRGIGAEILGAEVTGRAALHALSDLAERHCGLLGTPDLLRRLALYRRPEIVRLFGRQYDPARHNQGILWFDADAAIICKLDTSGALPQHQYVNRLLDPSTFLWTSQNRMRPDNAEGRRVLAHAASGERLHLFVQAASHAPACYLGQVRVIGHEGAGPIRVRLQLPVALPEGIPAG